MFKYSLFAAFIAYVLTTIAVSYTNDLGAGESILGAGLTATLMIEVWGRRKKRIPTPEEKTSFLFFYFLIMGALLFAPLIFVDKHTISGMVFMFIIAAVYPIWMAIFFNEKYLKKFVVENETNESN